MKKITFVIITLLFAVLTGCAEDSKNDCCNTHKPDKPCIPDNNTSKPDKPCPDKPCPDKPCIPECPSCNIPSVNWTITQLNAVYSPDEASNIVIYIDNVEDYNITHSFNKQDTAKYFDISYETIHNGFTIENNTIKDKYDYVLILKPKRILDRFQSYSCNTVFKFENKTNHKVTEATLPVALTPVLFHALDIKAYIPAPVEPVIFNQKENEKIIFIAIAQSKSDAVLDNGLFIGGEKFPLDLPRPAVLDFSFENNKLNSQSPDFGNKNSNFTINNKDQQFTLSDGSKIQNCLIDRMSDPDLHVCGLKILYTGNGDVQDTFYIRMLGAPDHNTDLAVELHGN